MVVLEDLMVLDEAVVVLVLRVVLEVVVEVELWCPWEVVVGRALEEVEEVVGMMEEAEVEKVQWSQVTPEMKVTEVLSFLLTVTVSVTVTVEAAAQPVVVGTATVVGTAGMSMTITVMALVGIAVTATVVYVEAVNQVV
jgi:hypothetical protein